MAKLDERFLENYRRALRDAEARGEFITKCRELMLPHMQRELGNPDDAEDAASLFTIRLHRAMTGGAAFEGDELEQLTGWLNSMSRNVTKDYKRHVQFYRQHGSMSLFSEIAGEEGRDVGDLIPSERRADLPHEATVSSLESLAVRRAVARLTPIHREALRLYHIEGLSYDECAARLNIPVGTIKSRINRARALLKANILGEEPGFDLPPGSGVRRAKR